MSEHSQGAGWWLASDGKWYPPESAPPPTCAPPAYPPTPYQPPAYLPDGYGYSTQPIRHTNSTAVASLVCGIIAPIGGFLCGVLGLLSIPAVILGHMALHEIKHDTVRQDGRGLAIGGLALGYATLAIGLVFVAIFALFLATPTE